MKNLFIILILLFLFNLIACQNVNTNEQKNKKKKQILGIRKPVVADKFYPNNTEELRSVINNFLANVPQQKEISPIALIVPHAGYIFSGQAMAYSYKLLEGEKEEKEEKERKKENYKTIIIIAPSHHSAYRGGSIWYEGAYQTPFGEIPIDEELAQKIMELNPLLNYLPAAHKKEHSIEVQLPFLQLVLSDFKIVPIVIGPYSNYQDLTLLASSITKAIGKRDDVLLIASSDLSHYPNYEKAQYSDGKILDAIKTFSVEKTLEIKAELLNENIEGLSTVACGMNPIIMIMLISQQLEANEIEILHYSNSGDIPKYGDKSSVVGYGAVAFYKNPNKDKIPLENLNRELTEEEQELLLTIARETITAKANKEKLEEYNITSPILNDKRGAFVTLHKEGNLRGCIGRFITDEPLYKVVENMAIQSAFDDYRFSPVEPKEIDALHIEISVLSPLRKIYNTDEIELGKHGIYIMKGNKGGCFLPQVATDTGWTKEEFLSYCCTEKARLSEDAWKDAETDIYIFTAQIFEEKE